jgi:hypothetical protein
VSVVVYVEGKEEERKKERKKERRKEQRRWGMESWEREGKERGDEGRVVRVRKSKDWEERIE